MSIAPSLDIVDAAVLDWALAYIASGNADKLTSGNETYHWLSYSACIKDLPLLHVSSKDSIRRRFKNLVDAKMLEEHSDNMRQGRTYFKAGSLASSLFFEPIQATDPSANLLYPPQNCVGPLRKNAEPPSAKMQGDYNTIDSNISDSIVLEASSRTFDFSSQPEKLTTLSIKT